MILPWALLFGGLALLVLAVRIGRSRTRGVAQGMAVLVAATGGVMLLRRPGSSLQLPGHGPRRWHQP